MELGYSISERSCSVISLTVAGTNSDNILAGSLIPSIRHSVTASDFLHDILRKKISDQKSTRRSSSKDVCENNTQNEIIPMNDNRLCFCSSCISLNDDFISYVRQQLENKLKSLKLELSNEKNASLILRKNIYVAKKVAKKELAIRSQDFESLMEKVNNKSWKGRQEMICNLKRELRHLNKIIDPLNEGTHSILFGNKSRTNDCTVYYLEMERNRVMENTEQHKQNLVDGRDVMKKKIEQFTYKSERLEEEIQRIRKKLSLSSEQIDQKLIQHFHGNQNELKAELKEKKYESRMINILEKEFYQNYIIKEKLKTDLDAQRQILKEKEEKIKTLKDEKTKHAVSEIGRRETDKIAKVRIQKLESAEKDYEKLVVKSVNLNEQCKNCKLRLENIRMLQFQKSSICIIRKSLSTSSVKNMKQQLDKQYEAAGDSNLRGNQTDSYKDKLLKLKSIFSVLKERNDNKLRKFSDLVSGIKELTSDLIEKRSRLWKIISDIKSLKSQNAELQNNYLRSTKQNLVKRNSSCHQMMEIVKEREKYLAFKKKENQCLKYLIRCVLAIKNDDCNMLQILLMRNYDAFLKKLNPCKI